MKLFVPGGSSSAFCQLLCFKNRVSGDVILPFYVKSEDYTTCTLEFFPKVRTILLMPLLDILGTSPASNLKR